MSPGFTHIIPYRRPGPGAREGKPASQCQLDPSYGAVDIITEDTAIRVSKCSLVVTAVGFYSPVVFSTSCWYSARNSENGGSPSTSRCARA